MVSFLVATGFLMIRSLPDRPTPVQKSRRRDAGPLRALTYSGPVRFLRSSKAILTLGLLPRTEDFLFALLDGDTLPQWRQQRDQRP